MPKITGVKRGNVGKAASMPVKPPSKPVALRKPATAQSTNKLKQSVQGGKLGPTAVASCIACGGSGLASSGEPCRCCVGRGWRPLER